MPQNVRAVIARFKGSPWEVAEVVIPDPGPRGRGRRDQGLRRRGRFRRGSRTRARQARDSDQWRVPPARPDYQRSQRYWRPDTRLPGSANQGGPVAVPDDRIDRRTSRSDVDMGGPEPRLEAVQRRGPVVGVARGRSVSEHVHGRVVAHPGCHRHIARFEVMSASNVD